MFNAVNILEALKNYIRTRGGTSNAYNIAEAVNDLNSIPKGSGGGIPEAPIDDNQYARKNGDWSKVESSGGDIPSEVTNAIETHGMGWTSEEEVEGFDITWDGNVEGKDPVLGYYCKVSDTPLTRDQIIGANIVININDEDVLYENIPEGIAVVTPDYENIINIGATGYPFYAYAQYGFTYAPAISVLNDVEVWAGQDYVTIERGLYFVYSPDFGVRTVSIYKNTGAQQIYNKINDKYIDGVITFVYDYILHKASGEGVTSSEMANLFRCGKLLVYNKETQELCRPIALREHPSAAPYSEVIVVYVDNTTWELNYVSVMSIEGGGSPPS